MKTTKVEKADLHVTKRVYGSGADCQDSFQANYDSDLLILRFVVQNLDAWMPKYDFSVFPIF